MSFICDNFLFNTYNIVVLKNTKLKEEICAVAIIIITITTTLIIIQIVADAVAVVAVKTSKIHAVLVSQIITKDAAKTNLGTVMVATIAVITITNIKVVI